MNPFSSFDGVGTVFGIEATVIKDLLIKDKHEKHMRSTVPAVNDAYEQYLVVLRLAGNK